MVAALALFAMILVGCGQQPVSEAQVKVTTFADKVEQLPNNPEWKQIKTTVTVANKDEVKVKDVRVAVEYSDHIKKIAVNEPDFGYIGNTTLEPGEKLEYISRIAVKADALKKDTIPDDWPSVLASITLTWQEEDGRTGSETLELTEVEDQAEAEK